jgi:hypothetical protein
VRPHWRARTFVPLPTMWLAAVRALYTLPMVGVHVHAPRPCAPHCRACPLATRDPTNARASPPSAPLLRMRPRPCVSNEACVPPVRAHRSRSRPTPCTPLQYKFIKIVVHSTTCASRPSTTMGRMTAGCLDGDHSFLIHPHGPREYIHGRGCMHV